MNKPTLDQVKTLIFQSHNADSAIQALRFLPIAIAETYIFKSFHVLVGEDKIIFFDHNGEFCVFINNPLWHPESRKSFLAQLQEPAVQVPATAPAAGHLSATSEITLSAEAQHQVIPNCPRCGAQYADLVHDPVLKTDFIMCSDCDFKGEASQHLSTETVDK